MNKYKAFIFTLFSAFILISCTAKESVKQAPLAKAGVIDLRGWDFAKDGPVKLIGEWNWWWNELIEPDLFKEGIPQRKSLSFNMPGLWNGLDDPLNSNSKLEGRGFSTFSLKLLVDKADLAILASSMDTSFELILMSNGEVKSLIKAGKVSARPEESLPRFHPQVSASKSFEGEALLVMRVSNYSNYFGGPQHALVIGKKEELDSDFFLDQFISASLCGLLLIMALYHLGLFLQRKDDLASLAFAGTCFFTSLRQLIMSRFLFIVNPDSTELFWEIHHKLEFISLYFSCYFFTAFIHEIAPGKVLKISSNILLVGALSFTAATLIFGLDFSNASIQYFQAFNLLFILMFAKVIGEARKGNKIALYSFLGMVPVFLSALNDILFANGLIMSIYLIPYGVACFTLAQSYIISKKFSDAFRQAEYLSKNLKAEVKSQTKDLNAAKFAAERAMRDSELSKEISESRRKETEEAKQKIEELNRDIKEKVLKRYLPSDLVNQVLDGDIEFGARPESRDITVMFADICEFTRISEKYPAEKIAVALNLYLEEMIRVIGANGGTIDKFMGDGIMVFWGAPIAMAKADQVRCAVDCAKQMQASILALKSLWNKNGIDEDLKIRIGIHSGNAVVGNFGNDERSDYTAIGSIVNQTSRIESQAEPGSIFFSKEVSLFLKDAEFKLSGEYKLKGLERSVELFKAV